MSGIIIFQAKHCISYFYVLAPILEKFVHFRSKKSILLFHNHILVVVHRASSFSPENNYQRSISRVFFFGKQNIYSYGSLYPGLLLVE